MIMNNINSNPADAVRRLECGDCTLVVLNGGTMHVRFQRGINDLLDILHTQPEILRGAFVADKVVGKGAAALMILGGVERVYAAVLSRPAAQLFSASGVDMEYGSLVDNIINRAGTGICPVEALCEPCDTAEECKNLILEWTVKKK